jgi:glycosyltransferase involved in cell wall biosynthesis
MIPAVEICPFVPLGPGTRKHTTRILHVVGAMNRGGTETWLVDLLSRTDHTHFQHDLLAHANGAAGLDEAVKATGARLIQAPESSRPWSYSAKLRRVIEEHGPYDVVHAHLHHFSGLVLRSAAHAGVPVRIAHSHSDTRSIDGRANPARQLFLRLAKHWIRRYATRCLAVSRPAAASLFGEAWESDHRVSVVYCGVALEKFARLNLNRDAFRHSLGIPADARVFAHVGRFAEPKNHAFLIEIFSRIAQLEPNAWFALAGDGPLRPQIEVWADRAGIAHRTLFLGMRNDVPQLLGGLVDVLLLPSLWEGLPITLIESQAAGVRALYSDSITSEAEELPQLLRRVSLREPAGAWAVEAVSMAKSPPVIPGRDRLTGSRFDIRACVAKLEEIYSSAPRLGAE